MYTYIYIYIYIYICIVYNRYRYLLVTQEDSEQCHEQTSAIRRRLSVTWINKTTMMAMAAVMLMRMMSWADPRVALRWTEGCTSAAQLSPASGLRFPALKNLQRLASRSRLLCHMPAHTWRLGIQILIMSHATSTTWPRRTFSGTAKHSKSLNYKKNAGSSAYLERATTSCHSRGHAHQLYCIIDVFVPVD